MSEPTYTVTNMTTEPVCICVHALTLHDGSGRCHGSHGMSGFPCQCWCFRERGRPYTLQPDSTRIIELLERIEYNTRSR